MPTVIHTLIHSRRLRAVAVHTATLAVILAVPAAAHADPGIAVLAAPASLPQVIGNLQNWLLGILSAIATLFLVLAGVYWATAGGDPAAVERAKASLRNALIGYALAVLAPVLLGVVKGIVGAN